MATAWITYCWEDNKQQDVDYIAQKLEQLDVKVKLDRWNLQAGKRLWEQIENFISNPEQCDAWIFVATNNSLQSEACKEEFAYALQRALGSRGNTYPVIGLFLGPVEKNLIPAAISTRLYVSISDNDWQERIVSAVKGKEPNINRLAVEPYYAKIHKLSMGDKKFAIEVRPRAGLWAPFVAAIPLSEKEFVKPMIMAGPRDVPTGSGIHTGGEGELPDEQLWVMMGETQANPTTSYYVWCEKLPSRLVFGINGGQKFNIIIQPNNTIKIN